MQGHTEVETTLRTGCNVNEFTYRVVPSRLRSAERPRDAYVRTASKCRSSSWMLPGSPALASLRMEQRDVCDRRQ